LKDWDDSTLTKSNKYTSQSDMYQFGKMLEKLNIVNSDAGKNFITGLLNKKIFQRKYLKTLGSSKSCLPNNLLFLPNRLAYMGYIPCI
jgi:hypothetical protein